MWRAYCEHVTSSIERDAKQQEILIAVWEVLAAKGLGAVTIRSVAAAAGVSAGRVQHYFTTKTDLIRRSAQFMVDASEFVFREETADLEPRDELWALLGHSIPRSAESRAATGVYYSFVAAGVSDPDISEMLAEARRSTCDQVERLLHLCAPHAGERAPVAALQLVAMADGLTQEVLIGSLPAQRASDLLRNALGETLRELCRPRGAA